MSRWHWTIVAAVGAAAAVVLLIGAREEVFDGNFYAVSYTPSLLAGDHPYRDVFDPGLPLDIYLAAGVQWLTGYRVIGEFVRQWVFIVAGLMIAAHLALRLSGSGIATVVMMAIAVALLAATPIYHHSKIFFFPLTIWLGWRYIESPSPGRGAALGALAATAFLYRHDYGIYTGFASVVAFILARCADPASRRPGRMARDIGAFATAVVVLASPWALAAQAHEGLIEYTRVRSALYQGAPSPFVSALVRNPVALLSPPPAPPPRPGEIRFAWGESVDDGQRERLERRHGLRPVADGRATGRWRYDVPDIGDPGLMELQPLTFNTEGIDWTAVGAGRLPTLANVARWHAQMAALLALAMIVGGAAMVWRDRPRASRTAWLTIFSGIVLMALEQALFREPSYFVVVAPLTAALTAPFLASRAIAVRLATAVLVGLSAFATWVLVREAPLFRPWPYLAALSDTLALLAQSPPSYPDERFAYVRDCTVSDDRVLITGRTPLHVSYFTQRAIAGGHVNWRLGWRRDPEREAHSLALLQRQRVPFAFSTAGPVLEEMRGYPRIHAYLAEHYTPVEGAGGTIMVDTRRTPTRRYELTGMPCFR